MSDLVRLLLGRLKEQHKRIVVIGDTMIDRWIHGHLSECQDGCSKFIQQDVLETPGGAANAERCLSNWDVKTSLYGYTNKDCPIKCRYVEDDRIVFRADDDGPLTRGKGYQWQRDLAMEMVKHACGVLLSDYDKGFLTPAFIHEIVAICRSNRIPCVADAKRSPEIYAGCIIKGNLDWRARYGKADVVTRGDEPPVVDGMPVQCDLPAVRCVNHVGAGDCFSVHLMLALSCNFTLREAATIAHSAGRIYVQHAHNRPPLPHEIAADLSSISSRDIAHV